MIPNKVPAEIPGHPLLLAVLASALALLLLVSWSNLTEARREAYLEGFAEGAAAQHLATANQRLAAYAEGVAAAEETATYIQAAGVDCDGNMPIPAAEQ